MNETLTAVVAADGTATPTSAWAVVPWWSFGKTLIAAASLRLAEAGKLDLDACLPKRPYTLRQILRHRAGLPDYGGLPAYVEAIARGDAPWSDAELFAQVDAATPCFAPGAGWAYSNVGYLIARRHIEAVCDAGLGDVLRDWVLGPLEIRQARLAAGVEDMRATAFAGGWGYDPGWAFHGVVIGPVAEAALTLHRIFADGFLSSASCAAMQSWHPIGGAVPGRPWITAGYGLGLMMGMMQTRRGPMFLAGHGAGGPGSVGAVYGVPGAAQGRTVAAFAAGADQGAVEAEVLRGMLSPSGI